MRWSSEIVTAQDRETLTTAAHALDRVLLWRWYLVPNWDSRIFHIAYWDRFGHPDKPIREGFNFDYLVGRSGKGRGDRRGEGSSEAQRYPGRAAGRGIRPT